MSAEPICQKFFEISFSKLDMALARSFLKILSSSFFCKHPHFLCKKGLCIKIGGSSGVMGGHFWSETGFRGPKGGYPLKNSPEIFCQRIDRKSQEV